MTILKGKSIESFTSFWLSIIALVWLGLFVLVLWQLKLSPGQITLASLFMSVGWGWLIVNFRSKILTGFNRALLHLEAVKIDDYKQFSKPIFSEGLVGKLHQQLKELSEDLSIKKQRYDQHVFLVYQLIDQLDTPVLVFNHKEKLSYANGAFSLLYDEPWQRFRHASPKLLGLVNVEGKWHLTQENSHKKHQWQISQSLFLENGVAHQLLVFTNIESAVRLSQVKAWQQIINVMGHEIRNSLTPVSTIAETLSERAESDRDKDALALISDRCIHLQDFVNRYASIAKQINLNYQQVNVTQLATRLQVLFDTKKLEFTDTTQWVWADKSILEQVLINLIKNAYEAESNKVLMEFKNKKDKTIIKVIDNGHGFANLENAFVPLFSTKQEGQGIGLSFCRNIIEQHSGQMTIENNETAGITVTITLPKPIGSDIGLG